MSHPLIYTAVYRLGPLADREIYRQLCRSRDFLAANIERPMRLQDAALEAYLSPYHFHRLFHSAFGETPHQFVSRLRMERAKQLLLREEMPVTEICYAIGYQSLGSFSTRFKAVVGASPTDFQMLSRRVFQVPKLIRRPVMPCCFMTFHGVGNP